MKKIKLILFFVVLSISSKAQDYEKKLTTELQYDVEKKELVFTLVNQVDTAIVIPAFTTSRNTYTVYYPNGDAFLVPDLGTSHWLATVEPKKNLVIKQDFKTLLNGISELTANRKKQKHLEKMYGGYKIEWAIDGLPSTIIVLEYKE